MPSTSCGKQFFKFPGIKTYFLVWSLHFGSARGYLFWAPLFAQYKVSYLPARARILSKTDFFWGGGKAALNARFVPLVSHARPINRTQNHYDSHDKRKSNSCSKKSEYFFPPPWVRGSREVLSIVWPTSTQKRVTITWARRDFTFKTLHFWMVFRRPDRIESKTLCGSYQGSWNRAIRCLDSCEIYNFKLVSKSIRLICAFKK